jgi:hypothetical protein
MLHFIVTKEWSEVYPTSCTKYCLDIIRQGWLAGSISVMKFSSFPDLLLISFGCIVKEHGTYISCTDIMYKFLHNTYFLLYTAWNLKQSISYNWDFDITL